jgi:hypothetical protein
MFIGILADKFKRIMMIGIPYELMKIYRDTGIDLLQYLPVCLIGETWCDWDESFIYNAY